jgi:hypothetical protein
MPFSLGSASQIPRRPDCMRNTQHQTVEPGARWFSRLLDGDHPWGSYDVKISRYSVRRYRLIIYPPGTTAADRRLARLRRGWPLGGAVLVLFAIMIGDAVSSPYTVPAVAITAYVSIRVLLFLLAGPKRVHVKSMSIVLIPGTADENERRRHTEWKILTHMLARADHMLSTYAISPVEYEAIWWQAYDRLDGDVAGPVLGAGRRIAAVDASQPGRDRV